MEDNNTTYEETLENIEESSEENIQNDDIPTSTESSTESGENSSIDNSGDDIGIPETVEESAAVPEETGTAVDSTEETTEELETIEEELTIEEYVSGNEIPEQVAVYYQLETETEESIPFLDKPLNEYTTSEGLLLLIFILAFVGLWYKIIFD